MKAQTTVSIPIELIPEIGKVQREQGISMNKAIVSLMELGLLQYKKQMNSDGEDVHPIRTD